MNKSFSVPGTAWVALVTLLIGALSGWLNEWIEAPWVPLATLGISTALKLLQLGYEIYGPKPAIGTRSVERKPSLLTRVFFG